MDGFDTALLPDYSKDRRGNLICDFQKYTALIFALDSATTTYLVQPILLSQGSLKKYSVHTSQTTLRKPLTKQSLWVVHP